MSLRARLLTALAGSGLAILLATFVVREIGVQYASEASIQSSLAARMSSIDRETCEKGREFGRFDSRMRRPGEPGDEPPRVHPSESPEERERRPPPSPEPERPRGEGRSRFGGPQGGPRLTRVFFYDPQFTPRPPGGPTFPEAARAGLRLGEPSVSGRDEGGFYGALATPWAGGPCTYALAILPTPPPLAAFGSMILGALLLISVPALALWFASAQPVARIQSLASEVREAAAQRYETSVSVTGKDEIAQLAVAFNDASAVVRAHVKEVERREKALRDFVAHTTHDVALPLSVLLSQVTNLRQKSLGGSTDETVRAIAQETQYIASLLANLEAVSRLESEPALHERHPVDLAALVERVAARHRGVAASAGVDFNHSAPATGVWITGDVTLLEQAANNLVHNAIQYNHAGGHVALVLDAEDRRFSLRVSDDGPGVGEQDVARLGESRFRSDEARSRRPNGMGLGLSIARDVASRHGLTLSLGNRAEGGFEAILEGPREENPKP